MSIARKEWSTHEAPTEAAEPAADTLVKQALRSGEGHRVTLSDASGPVVSVWAPSASGAWVDAHNLAAARRRNPSRVLRVDRRRVL